MARHNPEHYMQRALEAAQAAYARAEVPVGVVIVHRESGEVLLVAGNETETLFDPTAHAEIQAIRAACAQLKSPRIPDYDLYVTLEPCAMCAGAIANARIGRVFYGASDPKGGGVEHGAKLFTQPTCHHRPEVHSGQFAEESAALLRKFFKERRK